jgi:amidophosphoribosyltransferase
MCGIIGIFKHEGNVNVELYEGLLMLQHRGQDSAGMVTTDWDKFKEVKENGLVKDVFADTGLMDSMQGECACQCDLQAMVYPHNHHHSQPALGALCHK